MKSNNQKYRFAAAVYGPNTSDRMALSKFVGKLKTQNTRVGGVLQVALLNTENEVTGLDALDIASGCRIPISRPSANPDECGLDVGALTKTTGIIRKAIDDQSALIVVEKFGELEQSGKGLIDEVLQAIAEGVPVLISVPESALELWQTRTGELGAVLPFSHEAFDQWWQTIESS